MRILKIELQNINSLKCEQPIVVDFESKAFQDVGLFAITGSTGAGKTTLLDAITIALYHNVPRFNKSNSKGSLEDVVSYGAAEAMARITFQTNNKRFEAFWSMRLKTQSGNKLANPREEVRLKNLTEKTIVAEKKRDVQQAVEEITQLTYQQFLRSVMLAQGEFAAFLSASAKDKGNLLEQITGEEIYKKIGEAVGQRITEESKLLYDIKAKINTLDLLSEEQRQALQSEQAQLTTNLNQLNSQLQKFEEALNWFKKLSELEASKSLLADKEKEHQAQTLAQERIISKLAKHHLAEPFKDVLTQISHLGKSINEKRTRQKQYEAFIKKAQEAEIIITQKERFAQNERNEKEKELVIWQPKLDTVNKLDTDLKRLNSLKETALKTQNEIHSSITSNQKTSTKLNVELEQLTKEQKQIEAFLHNNKHLPAIENLMSTWIEQFTKRQLKHELIHSKNQEEIQLKTAYDILVQDLSAIDENYHKEVTLIAQLQKELDQIHAQLKDNSLDALLKQQNVLNTEREQLLKLHTYSKEYEQQVVQLNNLEEIQQANEETISPLLKKLSEIETELNKAKVSLNDAEQMLEMERVIKSFDEERQKLKEGVACALCGSTHHPYVEKYGQVKLDATQLKVQDRKELVDKLSKEENNIQLMLAEKKVIKETNLKQLAGLKQEVDTIRANFSREKSIWQIEQKEAILDEGKQLSQMLTSCTTKIEKVQQLQKKKDAKDNEWKTATVKFNELKNQQTNLNSQKKNNKNQHLRATKDIELLSKELVSIENKLEQSLAPFQFKLLSLDKTKAFIVDLENKISAYKKHVLQQSEIDKNTAQSLLNIKHVESLLSEKNKEYKQAQQQIETYKAEESAFFKTRTEILPIAFSFEDKRLELQDAIKKANSTVQQITDDKIKLQQELKSNENALKETLSDMDSESQKLKEQTDHLEINIQSSSFYDRNDLESSLLNIEDKSQYEAIKKQLDEEAIELKTLQQKLTKENELLHEQKTFDYNKPEAVDGKEALIGKNNELNKRIGEISQQFTKDSQIQERNKGVVEEIKQQELKLRKYTDLNKLLGGSKHAFNTYVQRLTLKRLIAIANRHLYHLNQRYSLRMNAVYKSGEELNFMLIDHYQTNVARLVDTSSGGEKFLISLSLALGLSDLASKNVNIGSLFIDEGFGTLDNTTLETVIATLSTLQSQGKMIGIISHVENLKERIPTQIRVLKKQNGVSEIEIV